MPDVRPRLIDFHSHYYDTAWHVVPASGALARAWPLLTDIEAQLAAMDGAGIDAKVLSAPSAVFLARGEPLRRAMMERINDRLAELVAAYPERLLALATIDAFQGDAAAYEVERVAGTLGLRGICLDCARLDRYLDDPAARPTLEAAAALGVAIFVHPVSPAGLTERLARLGHTGVLLARGTENAASVLALLRGGILDELPDLTIVLPMIGAAALLFAGLADQEHGHEDGWPGRRQLPGTTRRRLYVDTMGFDAAAIRFTVALLGAEHVLLGSDWPIMPIATRRLIAEALDAAGLTEAQQAAVCSGNTARLLAPAERR